WWVKLRPTFAVYVSQSHIRAKVFATRVRLFVVRLVKLVKSAARRSRVCFMIKQFNANQARLRRHRRMRSHLEGSQGRPRLSVFRSGQHIYAQIIDDTTGRTLVAASSLDESLRDFKTAVSVQERAADAPHTLVDKATEVIEMAAEVLPIKAGKGAKTEKRAQKAQAKGGQQQTGG